MYYSSTYGQTWAAASGATTGMIVVAMSASGQYAICASANTSPNYIYYSTNYGQTWTASSYSSASSQNWYGCAMSSNGQYLLVVNASAINAVQSITRFPTVYTNQVQAPLITYADNSAAITATPALDYTTFGQNWITGNTSVTGTYIGCSMSANGQYQIACMYGSGGIYYSSNYGQTWALATSTSTISWIACAMSASGQYCIATVQPASGLIYISSNYGQTWSSTGQATINQTRCAISGTGQYMIACGGVSGSSSPIYVSNNYGATWTTAGPTLTWYSCAMSTSGQYMYAGTSSATAVYVSSNYGQTWTPVTVHSSATQSFSITCSASGQYACTTDVSQYIYYSSNYGLSWTRATSPVAPFGGMAMSASGQYVIAGGTTADNQALYYSINYGQNWTIVPSSPIASWFACAMSANGQYLLAAPITGSSFIRQSITRFPPQSITSQSTTTSTVLSLLAPNITGTQNVGIVLGRSITSNNYATIGFQYIGDGSTANYVGIGVTAPSRLCIAGTGNVGIGTTNPTAVLSIVTPGATQTGSLSNSSTCTLSGNGEAYYNVWDGGRSGLFGCDSGSNYVFTGSLSSHDYVIRTSNNERIRVGATSGSVGIKTSTPVALLDTAGTIRALDATYVPLSGGTGVEIFYSGGGNIVSGTRNAGSLTTATLGYQASTHSFYVGTSAGITAMTISTTGINVNGIVLSNNDYSLLLGRNSFVYGAAGGNNNTGTTIGNNAGKSGMTGQRNTLVGAYTGFSLTTGDINTFVGSYAGGALTTGYGNTAVGDSCLGNLVTGSGNVSIGYYAGGARDGLTNCIYIGNQCTGTASATDEIIIGSGITGRGTNSAIIKCTAGGLFLTGYTTNGTASFTNSIGQIISSSDIRLKNNITYINDTVTALTQINNLKPATFCFNGSTDLNYGFIAQDVEQHIPLAVDGKKHEYEWETESSGKPKFDENGQIIYKLDKDGNKIIRPRGLSTTAIIAAQTLAIQELSKQITELKQRLATAGIP
jgi:hypothetical protein